MDRRDPPPPMVHGVRKHAVSALLWLRVLWLVACSSDSPVRFVRALRRLRAARGRAPHWATRKLARASSRYYWDLYTPGWPSPAFDRFITAEIDRFGASGGRQTALQVAIVAMTRRCALRCEHCFEWDVLNRSETLSIGDLLGILRQLQARGVGQVLFTGGEPLQRFEDLLVLVGAVHDDSDAWIASSGRGLTAERAVRLRAAGLTGVLLSLDHWDGEAHDRFRGLPGTFEALCRGAAYARGAGLLVALSLCPTRAFVSRENLDQYARVARSLGAGFIQILEPKPVGHYAGQDVALEPWQRRELERFTERLNCDPEKRGLPAVTYLDWFARSHGCAGAGARYLYVDTEGELHACPFCRGATAGQVDGDLDAAIAKLQAGGCPAAGRGDPAPAHAGGLNRGNVFAGVRTRSAAAPTGRK